MDRPDMREFLVQMKIHKHEMEAIYVELATLEDALGIFCPLAIDADDAVETEGRPSTEQYNDVRDATIHKLHNELAEAEHSLSRVKGIIGGIRSKLTRVKVTTHRIIQDLRIERDSLKRQCESPEQTLAEAKAEIERLRKERDTVRLDLGLWLEANKELVADAEIGRLVRRMTPNTRLDAEQGGIWSTRRFVGSAYRFWAAPEIRTADLAEALRAIQKERAE